MTKKENLTNWKLVEQGENEIAKPQHIFRITNTQTHIQRMDEYKNIV